MLTPLLVLALFAGPLGSEPVPRELDWVEVVVSGPRDRALLRRFASDVDDHFHAPDRARLFACDLEQARLRRLGLELSVLRENVSEFYAQRAAAHTFLAGGSLGGYRTYNEMRIALVQLAAQYPSVVSTPFSIGSSVQGRELWAVRISNSPAVHDWSEPTVWFDGLHHAREAISGEAVLRFAEYLAQTYSGNAAVRALVDERNLLFIPCVNPDGYEFNRALAPGGGGMWRKNMSSNSDGTSGVDLNRNYSWEWGAAWPGSSGVPGFTDYRGPHAFSEPESSALRDLAVLEPPDLSISCHSYGGRCLLPWGYDTVLTPHDSTFRSLAAGFADPLGWSFGTVWESLYFANGTSVDFQYGTHGTLALAIEIGSEADGFWPAGPRIDELCTELRPGFLELARRAGPAPRVASAELVEVAGDGDASKEAGEIWAVEVMLLNEGLRPSTGSLRLQVPADLVDWIAAPMQFELAPGEHREDRFQLPLSAQAAAGRVARLALELDAPGAISAANVILAIGQTHVLAAEGFEFPTAGWQVESSGSGAWQRADPQPVVDLASGETTQPDEDASGATDGSCWVTGATAGADSASNDLDGLTQLISPRFDASGFEHVELEYRRWSTRLAPSFDSVKSFRVSVSNDDGQSWHELEALGHDNEWRRTRLDLQELTQLTSSMRLRFSVSDQPDSGVTEGLLDDFVLRTVADAPTLASWGRAQPGDAPRLFVHAPEAAGRSFRIRRSLGTGAGTAVAGTAGLDQLTGHVQVLAAGVLDADGRAELSFPLTPLLNPIGGLVYLQAWVDEGGSQAAFSNLCKVRVE